MEYEMRKEFEFSVKGNKVKVVNTWTGGIKLYINGDNRDHYTGKYASGKNALLSANLGESGILEIFPKSGFFSVEMDAFLVTENEKQHIYSSDKRLTLKERRLAK
jgi:hypothetical protein